MKQLHMRAPGFSLIEVLISLIMVSVTITTLLTLQGSLQKILFKDNSQWHAEQLALQAFVDAEKQPYADPGKTIEREQDDFKIVYSVAQPQDGPLKEIEGCVIEKVVVSWAKLFSAQSFTLVKYSYRPPKKEKNKTEAAAQEVTGKNPAIPSDDKLGLNNAAEKVTP